MPSISDDTKEWLAYAKRDLDSANFLLSMKPIPLEIICYHCQQSAEKAVKAFMVENRIEVIKTHDLRLLRKTCSEISDFSEIENECALLTPYASQNRYPFGMEVEEGDMRIALTAAQKIWDFIQKKFN